MRWKRAIRSVCVKENTCPTWSDPLTVGGGVSMAYTSARGRVRSNRYTPDASHCEIHLVSSPSSAGFSGSCRRAGSGPVSGGDESGMRLILLEGRFDAFDLFADQALGHRRHQV